MSKYVEWKEDRSIEPPLEAEYDQFARSFAHAALEAAMKGQKGEAAVRMKQLWLEGIRIGYRMGKSYGVGATRKGQDKHYLDLCREIAQIESQRGISHKAAKKEVLRKNKIKESTLYTTRRKEYAEMCEVAVEDIPTVAKIVRQLKAEMEAEAET